MNYWFCPHIDRYICFNRNNISCCTVGNNTKNQSILYIKEFYNGEYIDWDKFFEERAKIKEDYKNGKHLANCENCSFLSYENWDKKNLKDEFKYIQFSHWQRCNSDCIYCENHIPSGKSLNNSESETYDSVPILKNLIQKGYVNNCTKVDFAGGEPTLYYKFNDLLKLLIDLKNSNILVHTNAILYNKTIAKGIRKGLVSICISVDAGSQRMHEKVKGVISYKKVWAHINKYTKVKNPFKSNYIALKYIIVPDLNDSEEEILLFIKKARKACADVLYLNVDNNVYINICDEERLTKIFKRVVELAEYFISVCKKYNMPIKLEYNVLYAYRATQIKQPEIEHYNKKNCFNIKQFMKWLLPF